jgi:hypothetical protein
MPIKMNRIVPLMAAGAAAVAIAAAPAAAATVTTQVDGSAVRQTPGNVEITTGPGVEAREAAQAQQPFGGSMGALIFHH